VLVWLKNSSNRIVQVRCPCLFDVIAEDMCDYLALSEFDQPLNTDGKRKRVFHVESPRVECVPGKKNARLTVVYRN